MARDPNMLSTGEAADVIGVSKSTVIKLIKTRKLAAGTVPGSTHHRIDRKVAEAMRDVMREQLSGHAGDAPPEL